MTPLNVSIMISLFLVASCILGGLLYFIFRPIRELVQKSRSNSALVKKIKRLQELDLLLEDGNTLAALEILPEILALNPPSSLDLLSATRDHNQVFLARCLSISDALGTGISNIETIEHLVNEHSELSTLLFKVRLSFDTLLGKRENEGKDMPQWTKDEYERKEAEVQESINKNVTQLKKEVARMLTILKTSSSSSHMIH